MKYIKIKYRLLVYLTCFTVFLEILKKKSSENDQSIGNFQCFFIYLFSSPENSVNQLITNSGLSRMDFIIVGVLSNFRVVYNRWYIFICLFKF